MFDNNGYFGVFLVISVNCRLFRYFGSYSGISVIPVILVNRRTDFEVPTREFYRWCGLHKLPQFEKGFSSL